MSLSRQLLIAVLLLVSVVLLSEITRIDLSLQEYFYNADVRQWLVDDNNAVARFVFYDGIKKLYIGFVLLAIVAVLLSGKVKLFQQYKTGLMIVMLSTILVPLVVNGLKAVTNVPCPKHLRHFGGDYPYVTILKAYPDGFQQDKPVRCYPAGHASGGFALMSLFFLFRGRRAKKLALTTAIALGWITGGYKMLIGDHFFSHTLVSMLLAWVLILLIVKGIERVYPAESSLVS